MKDVSYITICKDNYKSKEEWELAICNVIMILLNEDYIIRVKMDEKALGIVLIEFDYADLDLCS